MAGAASGSTDDADRSQAAATRLEGKVERGGATADGVALISTLFSSFQ